MTKKKELSKSDREYLENNRNLDASQLSKDVNVSVGIVRDFVENLPKHDVNKQDEDVVVKKEENAQRTTKELYGRHKTRKGIVVSTPAASEAADATRHHRINKGNQTEGIIHRCLDD